jgi:hypothetical protein
MRASQCLIQQSGFLKNAGWKHHRICYILYRSPSKQKFISLYDPCKICLQCCVHRQLHKLLGKKIFISFIAHFIFMEIILVRVHCACSPTWYIQVKLFGLNMYGYVAYICCVCLSSVSTPFRPYMRGDLIHRCVASKTVLRHAEKYDERRMTHQGGQLPTYEYAAWPLTGLSFPRTQPKAAYRTQLPMYTAKGAYRTQPSMYAAGSSQNSASHVRSLAAHRTQLPMLKSIKRMLSVRLKSSAYA